VLVTKMLDAIKEYHHTIPLLDHMRARPGPANELARSFQRPIQAPRCVTLAFGGSDHFPDTRGSSPSSCAITLQRNYPIHLGNGARPSGACLLLILDSVSRHDGTVSKTLTRKSGVAALQTAIDCGFTAAIDCLLPQMMMRADIARYNLLIDAVDHQPALVPKLYSHFERAGKGAALLHYTDPWGATAFDKVMEYGYCGLARFLLEKGATYDEYRLKGDHSIGDGTRSTSASVLPRRKAIEFLMVLTPKPNLVVTSTGFNVFHILATDEKHISTSHVLFLFLV